MIHDARTLPELGTLESSLRAWHQHPLYDELSSLFTARLRELSAIPGAHQQPPPRPLSAHEARRMTKRLLRTTSVAELDSIVERVKLRYAAGPSRDDVETFASVRRERLARLTPAFDGFGSQAPPSDRRR